MIQKVEIKLTANRATSILKHVCKLKKFRLTDLRLASAQNYKYRLFNRDQKKLEPCLIKFIA